MTTIHMQDELRKKEKLSYIALFRAKPLSVATVAYRQLDPQENI